MSRAKERVSCETAEYLKAMKQLEETSNMLAEAQVSSPKVISLLMKANRALGCGKVEEARRNINWAMKLIETRTLKTRMK